jgi:D-alanyl-D-alanine carboxypeptidase (penicillin-binding protein 5/6)
MLGSSVLVLLVVVFGATHLSLWHRTPAITPAPVARAQAAEGRAAPVASGPIDAGQSLLNPPYSWDYRWGAAHPALGAPSVRAKTALLVDVDNRHVLFNRLPHAPMAPASTTKLTTAMVALDHADADSTVTVPDEAINVEPNLMGLSAGEQLTVRELLYGLMLDSGNDAAETLAATTMPKRQSFIRAMNLKAAALGLTDTHFVNPSGLDDGQQMTSAHDLALTAAYLYQHYPAIADVVATKQETLPYSSLHKAFYPTNLNKMLWTYPGAIGFKTGLTDNAGQVFVGGAHRGNRTLVVVEMDDPLIFTDAAALLDYGFRREG